MSVIYDVSDDELRLIARWMRFQAFAAVASAGNGHLGAAGSSAEMLAALYFGGLLVCSEPGEQAPDRDRVLIRGHVGPLRAAAFSLLGHVAQAELETYRSLGSRLQGHEDHHLLPCVDVSPTGSLGMLLSYGVGIALSYEASYYAFRTVVFLGDGEEQEGNVSEAARHAAHLRLPGLIAVLDRNRKMLSGPIDQSDSSSPATVWRAYGWRVIEVPDGHDVQALRSAYRAALDPAGNCTPTLIIANTLKGAGLSGANDHVSGYHTLGVTPRNILDEALAHLKTQIPVGFNPATVLTRVAKQRARVRSRLSSCRPTVRIKPTATTSADPTEAQTEYFAGLSATLMSDENIAPGYFLTADVTYLSTIEAAKIDQAMRFINVGLREQHAFAVAHGLSVTEPDSTVIINTGDAFTFRPFDQIHAIAQGRSRVLIIGDVAGLTEARNGASHQSSGQPGSLLAIPGMTLLEPADTIDLYECLNWALSDSDGPVFVRVSRGPVKPWRRDELRGTTTWCTLEPIIPPTIAIIASGPTVSHAAHASTELLRSGISARVVNVVNQKSLDGLFARRVLSDVTCVLCVYNGSAHVLAKSVALAHITGGTRPVRFAAAGFERGTSGPTHQLFEYFGLDQSGIVQRCRELLAE